MGTLSERNKHIARLVYTALRDHKGQKVKINEETLLATALFCLDQLFPIKIWTRSDDSGPPMEEEEAPTAPRGEALPARRRADEGASVKARRTRPYRPPATALITDEEKNIVQINTDELRKRNFARFKRLRASQPQFEPLPDEEMIQENTLVECGNCNHKITQDKIDDSFSGPVDICMPCGDEMTRKEYVQLVKSLTTRKNTLIDEIVDE